MSRQHVSSGSPLEPVIGFSRAVRDDAEAVGRVHGEVFGEVRPASGFILVSGFIDPRWRVEIEADAIVEDGAGA